MPLETITNGIQDLNKSWPTGTDPKSQGDDHIRNVKDAIQLTFPNSTAPWQTTDEIKGTGYDSQGGVISNVGQPVDPADAARLGDIDAQNSVIADLVAQVDALTADLQQLGTRSWGAIGSSGTSGSSPGSNDWTASRVGVGAYRIVFDKASIIDDFNQSVQLTVLNTGLVTITGVVKIINTTTVEAYFRESEGSSNSPIDSTFSFTRVVDY